ncbi:MAG: hypothetical protein ACTSWI_00910 [Alphaproteobacteria bacterium]
MSPRGYISLAIATGITLIAAIALVIAQQIEASGDRRGGGLMFAELAERLTDVQAVSIVTPRYSIALEQLPNGEWVATDRGAYTINAPPLDQLVRGLAELVEYEAKTTTAEFYVDLGVEGPGDGRGDVLVTVTADDGDVLVNAILGYAAQSIGRHTRGGMFVRRVDEERVWLAEGAARPPSFVTEFFNMLFTVPGPTVGRVSIFAGETMLLDAIKVDFATGDFELEYLDPSIGPAGATAADSGIRGLSQAIVSTTFVNVQSVEDVNVADDARTVRFVTRDGLSLSITLADLEGTPYVIYRVEAQPGSPAEQQVADIAAVTEGWAFELRPGRIITLNRDLTQLFDPPVATPDTLPVEPDAPLVPIPAPGP